jgi:hypothetical protein
VRLAEFHDAGGWNVPRSHDRRRDGYYQWDSMLRLRIRDGCVRHFKKLSHVSVDGSPSGTTSVGGRNWST